METIIIAILIGVLIFFVARELMCWYWKINDIIKNQNEQLDQMDYLIGELSIQNKLVLRILEQLEPEEQPDDEQINEESTP